ncbi:thromboxane A2 receptor-like isoform X1 [Paramormyrops kingsleyae]|uniref:thromboxane A2 receptor-like isoform X1 n=1 Tax=Paramormyrops kingsleyae TaxID=1676925 RepID=UPI003B96EB2C
MVELTSYGNETTPLCFSRNQPPIHYNHSIVSPYLSPTFTAVGLSSNLIALIVLIRAYRRTHSRSRSSFLIFLSCLVVTDLTGLLVTSPVVTFYHTKGFNWIEVDPHCHLCNFMGMSMVFYGLCPLLLGAAMAVERFMGIWRPFSRSTRMSKGRVLLTVLLVWMFAGAVSLLPVIGLGSYHLQSPGSWCFFNMSSQTPDLMISLGYSLVGLLSLATSFVLNTVSVMTLLRICCGRDANHRRRNLEVEMMIQLIWIMIIATVSWCPLLIIQMFRLCWPPTWSQWKSNKKTDGLTATGFTATEDTQTGMEIFNGLDVHSSEAFMLIQY